ncbi:hypothetical protein BDB01DRAFT_770602 [Pilobolus umbonatus]|nr:hypothetical protein BDB01DRAFT_770602 [Pilobolus umbonatus]
MTQPIHPLQSDNNNNNSQIVPDIMTDTNHSNTNYTTSNTRPQQRAHSVTAMPSELQKSVMRHQEAQHQEKLRHNQPWWQYYYQLYHYQLPPGRKPTVFGPYLLLQTMGEGEFGKVKFAIEIKSGQEVAIKLIRKDSIDSSSRMTKVEREISVLRILNHPFIVKLYDVIETEKYIGIILQCATGGELFDYILAHRYLKEKDASRLFAQLVSGVHYMHQKHIVHRDLKLENLLLDRHRNVIITDFGFANQFSSPSDDLMATSCGSPCYAAPELVMNQGMYVGSAADIWSCGVILFAMLCGYLPFDDDPANPESYNINLLYKYILNTPLTFPDYISDEACNLLSIMLVPDPEKRCTMEHIMAHSWLSPHRHLFTDIEEAGEEDEMIIENNSTVPVIERRNTIATPSYSLEPAVETDQKVPSIKEEEEEEEPEKTAEIVDTVMQQEDEMEEDQEVKKEVPIQIEEDTKMQDVQTESPVDEPIKQDEKNEEHSIPTDIIITPSPSTPRPKSTASSTEKVLHFLSGQNNTPKSAVSNTTDRRTRHMSLATPEEEKNSILHSKFLSSMQRRNQPIPVEAKKAVVPNVSASTPHPTKNKRPVHTSVIAPPPDPSNRGTRRKTLSLLVNSMADNKIPFSNRRQSTRLSTHDELPHKERVKMMPSVSENTISDKDKHRSAGKKLIDWFKKKPLSTMNRSTHHHSGDEFHSNDRLPNASSVEVTPASFNENSHSNNLPGPTHLTQDPKLRTHHGAVDQDALTSCKPNDIITHIKTTLNTMGLEYKRDTEYKLKCSRRKRMPPQPQRKMSSGTPFRNLLRRASTHHHEEETEKTIYGDPSVDPGDEVRFSVEVCKIKNLPGLYIVDIRRMKGNVWAYKFIYHRLLSGLNLGGKKGYLTPSKHQPTTPASKSVKESVVNDSTLIISPSPSDHRTSISSSNNTSKSVLLEDSISNREIAV